MGNGGLRLFRAFGIDVSLHWTWAIVAFFFIQSLARDFNSPMWAAATYFGLFAIVLLHEFGHALACKSVGGTAERIMLWPLGGIAFVNPPLRPGAVLWSIAAGPLVNVILVPVLWYLTQLFPAPTPSNAAAGDLGQSLMMLSYINLVLLVFNLLPIYPLDGGQILHSLLWFAIGFARGLMVVSVIGLIGAAGLFVLAAWHGRLFTIVMALFIATQAWRGFLTATALRRRADTSSPLEQQIRDVVQEETPVGPSEQVEPREEPRPTDPVTQRIIAESYEDALRRERLAALRGQRDNA
jgi:Zn-dependent protease